VTAIAILLGLAIGVIVGAVGGGGAILALPVLIYVLDEPVGPASTASLVVVSLAAAIGAGSLARHGRVCWTLAFRFALPAACGSLLGTLASRSIGGPALVLAFVPVMLVAAFATWRRSGEGSEVDTGCPEARLDRVLVAGLGVGVLTGFFGVGGGFVIVPVLTLWFETPFRRAVATSLVIITLTGATALGALLGTTVGERLPQRVLRRGFAVLVTAVAFALLIDVLALGGPPG
jgi:uncharacterized protein